MQAMEISVAEFINELEYFKENGKNCNVKFLSPANKLLALQTIDEDNPEAYILVDFVETEYESPITLTELIGKFADLGDDYSQTFIDFLEPENKSIILEEDSMSVDEAGDLVIRFSGYLVI